MYNMGLKTIWFNLVKNGTKTMELRLDDEKRRIIKIGDTINFLEEPDRVDKIVCEVVDLVHDISFEDLLKNDEFVKLSSGSIISKDELISELNKYYDIDKQNHYGVVGIVIKRSVL